MAGPDSSYSCLEIHICWKVDRDAKMEPPIQTEYLRSGGATILIFMEAEVVAAEGPQLVTCCPAHIPRIVIKTRNQPLDSVLIAMLLPELAPCIVVVAEVLASQDA